MNNNYLVAFFTFQIIAYRILTYVTAPLWLDSINPQTGNHTNTSDHQNTTSCHEIFPFFTVLSQGIVSFLFFAIILFVLLLFWPDKITEYERSYPKKHFWIQGGTSAVGSLIVNYALSGKRTAPYLQALLGNFNVPIQFTVRLLLLKKFPTGRKILCAVAVVTAEVICLLPSIVPSLDPKKKEEGGATGIGGILWPMVFLVAMIPAAVSNTLVERSVKDSKKSDNDQSSSVKLPMLNMVYYLFWFNLCFTIVQLCQFWTDIIPGYGTSSKLSEFGEKLSFNFLCMLGQTGCGYKVLLPGWLTLSANVLFTMASSYLLRYSEGANYVSIADTLRSPCLFLIWTLCDEHPFRWHPHVSLSTWLSIGALCIMVPAVYIYNTGPPERQVELNLRRRQRSQDDAPLIEGDAMSDQHFENLIDNNADNQSIDT